MEVDIIIPQYNNYHLTHQLLTDIKRTCKGLHRVIVVDDASSDKTYQKGLEWWKDNLLPELEVLEQTTNKGFLLTANEGLHFSDADIKILLNSDVRVFENIVENIFHILEKFPKTLVGGESLTKDTGWNCFDGEVYPYMAGWLLAMTSEGWEDVGYFDEDFAPFDFEDVALSTTALRKAYDLVELRKGMAKHLGGQSIGFSSEREKQTRKNQELFRKKYHEC